MLKREKTFCKGVYRISVIELKASRSKIEELKGKIEELKVALQNYKLRVELLEENNEQQQEQLHRSQDQVRDRDYVMGTSLTQVRVVANHLQTLQV
ncbi:hypothetical protein Gotur_031192 [Gossypium turneri]